VTNIRANGRKVSSTEKESILKLTEEVMKENGNSTYSMVKVLK
jgi:hypothetical protein